MALWWIITSPPFLQLRAWATVKTVLQPSHWVHRPSGFNPYLWRLLSIHSSNDSVVPLNLSGAMESHIPHCPIRSSRLMVFFGAPSIIPATTAFSRSIFSFLAVTLAARTWPLWVTDGSSVPFKGCNQDPRGGLGRLEEAVGPLYGVTDVHTSELHPVR